LAWTMSWARWKRVMMICSSSMMGRAHADSAVGQSWI
jgi:hypothetical protein